MNLRGGKKVLWAIDPYGEIKAQRPAAEMAKALAKTCDVEVVYVYGTLAFLAEAGKESIRFNIADAEARLKKTLEQLKFSSSKAPKILAHGSDSVRSHVLTLLEYARKKKSQMILVSTNARAGFLRHVLGSFAETLTLSSTVPVLVINPNAKVAPKPGTIVFPTDFSAYSWQTYKKAVDFAKTTNANILIFHQYQGDPQDVPETVEYFAKNKWVDRTHLYDQKLNDAKANEAKWIAWTKKQKVKCRSVINYGIKNISDAAIEQAKKEEAWMIAMASKTSSFPASFLGSNARWTLRAAHCPVWILYTNGKKS